MEDKMAAGAFGRATNYGWDDLSFKNFNYLQKGPLFSRLFDIQIILTGSEKRRLLINIKLISATHLSPFFVFYFDFLFIYLFWSSVCFFEFATNFEEEGTAQPFKKLKCLVLRRCQIFERRFNKDQNDKTENSYLDVNSNLLFVRDRK